MTFIQFKTNNRYFKEYSYMYMIKGLSESIDTYNFKGEPQFFESTIERSGYIRIKGTLWL